MKKIVLLVAFALALVGCSETKEVETQTLLDLPSEHIEILYNEDQERIWNDTQALELKFMDIEGNEVKLSGFTDKPMVLNYWTSWCSECNVVMPYFQEMYELYGDKVNFVMLNGLDNDKETEQMALEYWAENEYTMPMFFDRYEEDGEMLTRPAISIYDINKYTTTIFVDADGVISQRMQSKEVLTYDVIKAEIEKLIVE